MTDYAEEQEMEAEALEAIFDTLFTKKSPNEWTVQIYPETGDPSELDELNHVAVSLEISLSETYPEVLPNLAVSILKGLADDHRAILEKLAMDSATELLGTPSIFSVAEAIREWLVENNQKGLDDVSMYAQMIRKEQEKDKAQRKAQTAFESQATVDEMTATEAEELAVRKRRAEGTPCTEEHFSAWKERFEAEMAEKENQSEAVSGGSAVDKRKKVEDKSGRLTGREQFMSKGNNLEALEAAAEQAAEAEDVIDEDLFEDDVDLDDLDFDSDDEDDDDVNI